MAKVMIISIDREKIEHQNISTNFAALSMIVFGLEYSLFSEEEKILLLTNSSQSEHIYACI